MYQLAMSIVIAASQPYALPLKDLDRSGKLDLYDYRLLQLYHGNPVHEVGVMRLVRGDERTPLAERRVTASWYDSTNDVLLQSGTRTDGIIQADWLPVSAGYVVIEIEDGRINGGDTWSWEVSPATEEYSNHAEDQSRQGEACEAARQDQQDDPR